MPSDLTAALLSGNAGVAADPALAQIAPRMQIAQALAQQGMSGTPTTEWGGIGRIGSSLAGALIQADASSELSHLYEGGVEAASKALPSDHPLQPYLQSKNPMARMLGYQALPKALIQLSETKALKPGETAGYPVPGQPSTLANTGPVSETGKTVRDAQVAAAGGNPAAAGAISQNVTKQITTPEGVPYPAAPIVPHRVMTVPAPPLVPGVPSATGPAGPAGMPGAVAAAAGNKKGQEELFGAASKALGGVIGEHIESGGKAARDKLNALDTMESALASGGKGIITGPNAEFALKAKQALNGMGLSADWIDKGLPETEVISKMNAQLASASAKAMTGRPTQNEFNIWMRNNPGLATSKEGTKALIDILRQQTNNDIELGRLAQKKSNWENWGETVDKFYAEPGHALKNPITGKPMRDEIAAAHAGGAGGATAPNVQGAKLAPDGHWYVPDPKREGKFLRVER